MLPKDERDMCLLLLLSGDIETNPGPPKGSPAKRVKPPTEKEIMEGRVTNHDERLAALEKLVKDQKVVIDSMTKTQVELKTALDDSKVEFEKSVEENKVVSTSLEELKVKMKTRVEEQVCIPKNNLVHFTVTLQSFTLSYLDHVSFTSARGSKPMIHFPGSIVFGFSKQLNQHPFINFRISPLLVLDFNGSLGILSKPKSWFRTNSIFVRKGILYGTKGIVRDMK